MKYRVTHSTRYDYAQPVSLSHNIVLLHPRNHGGQTCLEHRLTIIPAPATRADQLDYFGNYCDYFCLQQTHSQLTIAAQSEVEVNACSWADLAHGPTWEQVRQELKHSSEADTIFAREFTFDSPHAMRSAELLEYARPSFAEGRPLLEAVMDLTKRIHGEFKFLPGSTNVNTPVLEVLHMKKGVCQDFSHLQIMLPPLAGLGRALRQRLPGDDASAGQEASGRRGRLARVGQRLFERGGVGRFRSDQWRDAVGRAHHHCLGPRLQRCRADSGHPGRRTPPPPARIGRRNAARAGLLTSSRYLQSPQLSKLFCAGARPSGPE